MDYDDDFDFDDGALDALPAHALQELETTAIRSTQQQHHVVSDYGIGDDDGAQLEDEVVNLNDIAPPLPHSHHYSHHHDHTGNYKYPSQSHAMDVDQPPRRSQADAGQLLLRIKKLEQEKARLAREVQSEKSKVQLKTGETETARRRLEAATRENERRLLTLQQSHNEALAKHRADMDKLRREREQTHTHNMFLEHDLAREADKSRRPKRNPRDGVPLMPKQNAAPSPTDSPRRQQKTLPLRDGFDDEDMVMASPTKIRDRSKALTPKQAGKRKRQVPDQSPVPALQLSEPRERPKFQETVLVADKPDTTLLGSPQKADRRFDLLHRLVNNRSSNGSDRVLEALTQYALPSQPERKLSSRLYDELSTCSLELNVHELAIRICHIFLSIWEQCLQEMYYAPMYLFLDALYFILAYEPCSTAVALTERAIPIILASVDLVAFPIARACMNHINATELYSPAQLQINSEVDVIDCLGLLDLMATSCVTSIGAMTYFWQRIPIDFPLHLLRKAQPLECIRRMLLILRTSHLPDSLGPRVLAQFGPEQQEKRETDLVDRLTKLLSDVPEPIPDPSTMATTPSQQAQSPATQMQELRLQILQLLTTFSTSDYGSSRLANLRYCIGRLIKFLDQQVASLYSEPLFPTRHLVIASINAAMKLIYHLKTSNPSLDIKSKLSVIPGGSHKYLVALTRLAFSERLVLEEGIEKEVADAAYAILDAGLTPEEGEGLLQVFSSGSSV